MTEIFGQDRKIRRSASANDEDEFQIFGSNSAYSGTDTPEPHDAVGSCVLASFGLQHLPSNFSHMEL
jgi:hypothetical protein